MKGTILTLLLAAALTLLPGVSAAAEPASGGTCGENLTWALDGEGTLTISGTGEMTDYPLNGAPWYDARGAVLSIRVGNGVTGIGNYAFGYCVNLTDVSIPEGVTRIGGYAFLGCWNLREIILPSGVTDIGNGAFNSCRSLQNITLPSSVRTIGNCAFEACESLERIRLPSGVTRIGRGAFSCCTGLTAVRIPSGVTEIENSVFSECSGLHDVVIPAGVTRIGYDAFRMCSGLVTAALPAGLSEIGMFAFADCTGLTGIAIPSGVTDIGMSAFENCVRLKYVTIPEEIAGISGYVFYGCTGLKGIMIPDSVSSFGADPFPKTAAVYCHEGSFAASWANDNGYRVVLLNADQGDGALTVTLPKTKSVGAGIICGMGETIFPRLPGMPVAWTSSDQTVAVISTDGVLTALKPGRTVITLEAGGITAQCQLTVKAIGRILNLPKSLTQISAQAFLNLTAVDAVRIPASVACIAEDAFDGADVIILAPAGSYAAQWALEHGFTVIEE